MSQKKITVTPESGDITTNFQFVLEGVSEFEEVYWTFGDVAEGEYWAPTRSHQYQSAGSYTVTAMVSYMSSPITATVTVS
ncbi:MAG: hypothetical protein K2Y01_05900 [Rhabdochlamydiaceae bacterium]|nr:hypothetical protein [Rhabdochlamydiaceae bacterium]